MRDVNIVLSFPKVIQEKRVASKEEIIKKDEDKVNKMVTVTTRLYDTDNQFLTDRMFQIIGSDYDFLMSDSPDFNEGKTKDNYRDEDLFVVIDLLNKTQSPA